MAKKAAPKPKIVKKAVKTKKAAPKERPITAKLTYTAEMEVMAVIHIMPGTTPDAVLDAIRKGKADFFHEIGEIEVNGVVLATLSKPHLLKDDYDDFEIEPI